MRQRHGVPRAIPGFSPARGSGIIGPPPALPADPEPEDAD
jgi:hypothetical protein